MPAKALLAILFALVIQFKLHAQQIPDTTYNPPILNPAYNLGDGSVVFIDEGHHNFHTKEGRYKTFANLLERDGYVVKAFTGDFDRYELAEGKILVISNALNEINVNDWFLPTPSAFTKEEINILDNWVSEGGSLFLIADHMPISGAATELAAAFGFTFTNGFAFDTTTQGPAFFNIANATLIESTITKGRDSSESVAQIVSFTGQAFQIPNDATPILVLNENFINIIPDTAWVFDESNRSYGVGGWSQGAYKKHGEGRIVAFGEAAMFSGQLAGPQKRKMGMNNPIADQNHQLLLNIIHWLDALID